MAFRQPQTPCKWAGGYSAVAFTTESRGPEEKSESRVYRRAIEVTVKLDYV